MLKKQIVYFGQQCILACDGNCNKAWGINSRPKNQLSEEDEDDYEWLSDNELKFAPQNPGTYEGDHAKPIITDEKLNKWCARECERSSIFKLDEPIILDDFNKRIPNIKR
jgi:hypothetical protein